MLDLPFRSATQLASALRRKKISCRELLDLYLARVERYTPALNAIIATDLDAARKRAGAADRALAKGTRWGPLHGVPMTIKESTTRGWCAPTLGAAFFEEWDLLLCPVASTAAFPHDHVGERHERTIVVNGKPVPTTDQLFWAGYSGVCFLPSTVAPIGLTPGGLPVGVQIVGPQYGDRTTIHFAQLLEREYQAFIPPPGYA